MKPEINIEINIKIDKKLIEKIECFEKDISKFCEPIKSKYELAHPFGSDVLYGRCNIASTDTREIVLVYSS